MCRQPIGRERRASAPFLRFCGDRVAMRIAGIAPYGIRVCYTPSQLVGHVFRVSPLEQGARCPWTCGSVSNRAATVRERIPGVPAPSRSQLGKSELAMATLTTNAPLAGDSRSPNRIEPVGLCSGRMVSPRIDHGNVGWFSNGFPDYAAIVSGSRSLTGATPSTGHDHRSYVGRSSLER